jgi:MscS family membrane protein
MLEETFYGNTVFQWAIALGIVVGTVVVGRIVYWVFKNIERKFSDATATKFDDILIDTIEEPLTFVLTLAGFYWALSTLTLTLTLSTWISKGFYFLIFITAAWLLARLFDALVQEYIAPKVAESESDLDDQLLPIIRKGIKAIIWIVAIIVGLDNAGYDVGAILAGLGLGGLAFAMAAKDTVANLFGGFTIFTDKPFTINDRIVVDGVEGTVKEIGVRSTRLQTLAGRTVVIPNAAFADTIIENVSSEPSRKISLDLGLTYDMTAEQLQQAMDLLKTIADEHSDSIEAKTLIGFNAFGDFSLNIFFAYYISPSASILDTQTSMNLAIYKRFAEAGLDFAFPSQTVYHKPVE